MFSIDLTSRIPIYEQIYTKIIELAISGTLNENDQLPSVRNLAKDTGVNPNTVAKAYQELERKGVIYSVPGRGSFIADMDNNVFQEASLLEFEKSTVTAMKWGVSADTMKQRIDLVFKRNKEVST